MNTYLAAIATSGIRVRLMITYEQLFYIPIHYSIYCLAQYSISSTVSASAKISPFFSPLFPFLSLPPFATYRTCLVAACACVAQFQMHRGFFINLTGDHMVKASTNTLMIYNQII